MQLKVSSRRKQTSSLGFGETVVLRKAAALAEWAWWSKGIFRRRGGRKERKKERNKEMKKKSVFKYDFTANLGSNFSSRLIVLINGGEVASVNERFALFCVIRNDFRSKTNHSNHTFHTTGKHPAHRHCPATQQAWLVCGCLCSAHCSQHRASTALARSWRSHKTLQSGALFDLVRGIFFLKNYFKR